VYGAGGHAKIVLAAIEAESRSTVVGLLDDDEAKHGQATYGYPVLGGTEQLSVLRGQGISDAVVAIGNNMRRTEIAQLLAASGFRLHRVIHPTATLLRGCNIGDGTVVLVQAFIGADAIVGSNSIVSVGVVVGHDSILGSGAHLCPGVRLGGATRIGDRAFLGMGAVVVPQGRVGHDAVVGANAVVIDDVPDFATVVGIPARIVNWAEPGFDGPK
jgi:sugar O-acyltransferase (sialic acid O-acetyltransferase NeuD family)